MNNIDKEAELKEVVERARRTIDALHETILEKERTIDSLEKEVTRWKDFVFRYELSSNVLNNDILSSTLSLHVRLFFSLREADRNALIKEQMTRHILQLQRALLPTHL